MTREQEMLALADEYEKGMKHCAASGYEEFGPDFQRRHQLVIDALRLAAQADAPAIQPQRMPSHTVPPFCAGTQDGVTPLAEALNEVITNGEWTKGDQGGEWKISKEVYDLAVDALAHTRPECGDI